MAEKLTASQIYSLLREGGFSDGDARTMTAIAQAESARDPGAIGDVGLQNGTWGPSVGLFQIRTLKAETGTGSDRDIEHLTGDPKAQVEAALHISDGGRSFRPWSTYTSGSYRNFLDTPLQTVPTDGLGTGAAAAAAPDPFAMDRGTRPVEVVDKDGDGLTDRFEDQLGTDKTSADSDRDSLSDSYEVLASHTDPLKADSDGDGTNDAAEGAAGSAPAGPGGPDTLDSDRDALSDGYERRLGTDPLSADSDGDGLGDAEEIARGTNPRAVDSDQDGIGDAFEAAQDLH